MSDRQTKTEAVIELCDTIYDNIYKAIGKAIDDDCSGSDLKNEIAARKDGIETLQSIIKKKASLEDMILKDSYTEGEKAWSGNVEDEYIEK